MSVIDPFDVLRDHLRAQVVPAPETTASDLVDRVLAGSIRPADLRSGRTRRRRRGLGFGLGVVVVAGGSLAAASLLRREDVTQPQAGTVCRAEASWTANAFVAPVSDDPVAVCRELWASGVMANVRAGEATDRSVPPDEIAVPDLVACVGNDGAAEVFPVAEGATCDALSLAPVGTTGFVGNPLVALTERFVAEINSQCIPFDDAPALVNQMLRDLGLSGWTIVLGSHRAELPCARAGFDPETRLIHVTHAPHPDSFGPTTAP